jgi:rhodanese-related sulfurtransferase
MLKSKVGSQSLISEDIFPSEAYELIREINDNPNLIILDISTPKEFANQHLENAVNFNLLSRTFKYRLYVLDKEQTYLVYCKLGARSKVAQMVMKKMGFRVVYNIVGGALLWEEEGLPFASGFEHASKFSLCPIFLTITLKKKIKKLFQTGLRSLANVVPAESRFAEEEQLLIND